MPTCPNCGEIVMNGDPYCSHCGTTFNWGYDEEYERPNHVGDFYTFVNLLVLVVERQDEDSANSYISRASYYCDLLSEDEKERLWRFMHQDKVIDAICNGYNMTDNLEAFKLIEEFDLPYKECEDCDAIFYGKSNYCNFCGKRLENPF